MLILVALRKQKHFVLDFGLKSADAMGGTDIGFTPRVTI